MVDSNGDGLDDVTGMPARRTIPKPGAKQPGPTSWFTDFLQGAPRDFLNFGNSVGNWITSNPQPARNQGWGDKVFGVPNKFKGTGMYSPTDRPNGSGGRIVGPQATAQNEMTFADALAQASALIGAGGGGGGGLPSVNYDPQRNELRSRASEYDARLEAMYRQLRDSIDADAPVLQQAYQGAIDTTRQNNTDAQAQTQAASDNANALNAQVLANLGIQQAQGNIVQNGTDLNTQTAQRMADQATKAQAANDLLASNQATALQHNTNIGNAAGLEGNLQRAQNSARLQALLAEIDMKEQQDNQAVAAQNASVRGNDLSNQISLAQWLMGQSTDERRYQDSLQQSAAAMASKGNQALPDLGAYLQMMGINPNDIAKDPQKYSDLLGALPKYSITQ